MSYSDDRSRKQFKEILEGCGLTNMRYTSGVSRGKLSNQFLSLELNIYIVTYLNSFQVVNARTKQLIKVHAPFSELTHKRGSDILPYLNRLSEFAKC